MNRSSCLRLFRESISKQEISETVAQFCARGRYENPLCVKLQRIREGKSAPLSSDDPIRSLNITNVEIGHAIQQYCVEDNPGAAICAKLRRLLSEHGPTTPEPPRHADESEGDRSAGELPACNDPKVKEALAGALRTYTNLIMREPTDLRSGNPHTRWCLAPLVGLPYPGLGGSCVELVFTIEWINEREGRFWVQSKSQQRRICL